MTKEANEATEHSRVPTLVEPREEDVIDGRRAAFSWKPASGAADYRVQVAADRSFEELIVDEPTGLRTRLMLKDVFPTDEKTYFWRVIARDLDGVLHGEDNIESFISGTATDQAEHFKAPDQDEQYGPLAGLFKGAAVEVAAEVTGHEKYAEEEEDLGVEHEGVEAAQILGLTLAIAMALALSIFALFQYFNITAKSARFEAAGMSGYPTLRENNFEALQKLSGFAAVEGEADRYRIPIDHAIELMANEAYLNEDGAAYSAELSLLPHE